MNRKKRESIVQIGRQFSDATLLLHEAIAARVGLSGADHKYLNILMQHGAMTAGQLAVFTGLTTGAVTGVIDRLEKKKLVKREADKTDRRKIMIVPNHENAMKQFGKIFTVLQQRIEKLMSTFSEKELDVIERYMLGATGVMNEVRELLHDKKDAA